MKFSIIVPTYKEAENLGPLMKRIASAMSGREYEVLVVDDNSPDGTAEKARALSKDYPVRVLERKDQRGLGSAILHGFMHAQGDALAVIDADLQHPPEVLHDLARAIANGADIAVASRYVRGGGIEHWSIPRRFLSKFAVLLAWPLTSVKDPVSGCFMLRPAVLRSANFKPIGYKLLLEILVRTRYKSVKEIPYTFQPRQRGTSKLDFREELRYLKLLTILYWHKFHPRPL